MTPHGYLTDRRIENAKFWISEGRLSLAESPTCAGSPPGPTSQSGSSELSAPRHGHIGRAAPSWGFFPPFGSLQRACQEGAAQFDDELVNYRTVFTISVLGVLSAIWVGEDAVPKPRSGPLWSKRSFPLPDGSASHSRRDLPSA